MRPPIVWAVSSESMATHFSRLVFHQRFAFQCRPFQNGIYEFDKSGVTESARGIILPTINFRCRNQSSLADPINRTGTSLEDTLHAAHAAKLRILLLTIENEAMPFGYVFDECTWNRVRSGGDGEWEGGSQSQLSAFIIIMLYSHLSRSHCCVIAWHAVTDFFFFVHEKAVRCRRRRRRRHHTNA